MFETSIIIQLLNKALQFAKNNAFCINGEYFSYSEFIQRIAVISESLQNNKENNIGLIANDDIDTYASIFAIWVTGKVYIPLSPETPEERNQNIIKQVGIKTILDSNKTQKLQSHDFFTSMSLLNTRIQTVDFNNQLAYIFFTSGSTGNPKGVTISKNNIASFVEAFWAMGYSINEADRCLQMFELTFDLSVMSYLIPLLKGACVYTIPKGKIKYSYIFELLDEQELTVALMVPSILNYLRPYFSEIDCPRLRYSLFCGEALHENIIDEWSKCVPNAQIDNVYGPTEDTIFCTRYTYNRDEKNDSHNGILSIGRSMLNNHAIVFNDINEPAGYSQIGELCLAGEQLTPGYFNNSALNKEMFFTVKHKGIETRFYRTGDLCLMRENGNIDYIGRKDSQVKIQGFRIELSEIEYHTKKAINEQFPLISIVLKNKSGNNEIAVVFESSEFELNGINEYLNSKIPPYMVPTKYYFLQQFPLNTNGKIDRKKIIEKFKI